MLLPVKCTTAGRTPGRFIKVLMVLEQLLNLLVPSKELQSRWTFFTQKANVTPWGGSGRDGSICLSCLSTVVISVKDYLLGASMVSNI